jgi:hypothetical protein
MNGRPAAGLNSGLVLMAESPVSPTNGTTILC